MAKRLKIRVVVDTNWYISASINRKSRRTLHRLLTDERLRIIYTDRLLEEFLAVIYRPKFATIISPEQIQRFVRLILPALEYVEIKTPVSLSRDPKDNYLLSLSKDGKAKYLVTGDPDLLVIGEFEGTEIVAMAEFQLVLEGL
jgi:uncharacterized protein